MAGTLGYFCRSTRHGDDPNQVYALSNNHVFANVNQGQYNDSLYQQSPADGATTAEYFAALQRFVPIKLNNNQPNRVDAAIGALLPTVNYQATICSIGAVSGIVTGAEGMIVRKHGRTTGYTRGQIVDHNVDQIVHMSHSNSAVVALFQGQMRIEGIGNTPAFARSGDSGSLVLNGTKATGLYFAGPDSGSYGLANQIGEVLAQLEITLV
jgi:hypothetical protein